MNKIMKYFSLSLLLLNAASTISGMQPKKTHEAAMNAFNRLTKKRILNFFSDPKGIFLGAITEDHTCLIIKSENNKFKLSATIKLDKKIIINVGIKNGILHITYEGNIVDLFAINSGSKINTIQADTSKKVRSIQITGNILHVSYEGKTDNSFTIDLFNVQSGSKIGDKTIQHQNISSIVPTLYTILYFVYKNNTIDVFDINLGSKINTIQANKNKKITDTKILSELLFVGYDDNSSETYDIYSGEITDQDFKCHNGMFMFGPKEQIQAFLEKMCPVCNEKKATKKCSRCKNAFYCSRRCQVKDWKKHKKVCSPSE